VIDWLDETAGAPSPLDGAAGEGAYWDTETGARRNARRLSGLFTRKAMTDLPPAAARRRWRRGRAFTRNLDHNALTVAA
jgi:hypothetical protein